MWSNTRCWCADPRLQHAVHGGVGWGGVGIREVALLGWGCGEGME